MALLDRRVFACARVLGFVAVGSVLPSLPACSGDDKSGIMLAVSTDMLAPKDVNAVGVTVFTDDKIKFNVVGRVTPEGEVLLPATLAIAEPDDPNATVRIRVVAFQERKARVMRDVRTSIPKGGRIALLRIPLNFANDGSVNGELPDGVLPAPATTTTKSLGRGTLFPRDFGTSDGYDPSLFVPNCANPTETWVAGQCVDAYVPWTSLPTYTPASVGRADDAATCFDTYGCFAGATDIPESGDTGVTLDRASCSLVLHGADPTKINVALVTSATGACIQTGSCYVPLDHGAAGWTESDGRVQLPGYVCQLTPAKASLVLSPSTAPASCGAKTESRAACTVTGDGGTGTVQSPLVSAEDFASSIAIEPGSTFLDTAGVGRVARIDLATGAATPLDIRAGKQPWKLVAARAGALLTDGTSTGYAIAPGGAVTTITLPTNGHDVAEMSTGRLWTVGTPVPSLAYSAGTGRNATFTGTQVLQPNAVVAMGNADFVAGTIDGNAYRCTLVDATGMNCFPSPTPLNGSAIVDALAVDPTSNGLGVWALTQNGLFYLLSDAATNTMTPTAVPTGPIIGPVDSVYLRHAIVGAGHCAIFSDPLGLEWRVIDDPSHTHGGSITLSASDHAGKTILGVTRDASFVYYSVYGAANDGGGIFRAAIPAECAAH